MVLCTQVTYRFKVCMLCLFPFIPFISKYYRSLLQPCIHNGVLAPTTEQRLKYKNWLHVYGKKNALLTSRMAQLLDEYKV